MAEKKYYPVGIPAPIEKVKDVKIAGTFMHWRKKWQPTPVFLPGETRGQEPNGLPSMGLHRIRHD